MTVNRLLAASVAGRSPPLTYYRQPVMNSRLLLCLILFAGLILSGCKKSEPEAPVTPSGKPQAARPVEPPTPVPPPVPAGPSESERRLAQQLRETQTRQLELELKLEEEKLARTEADIAKEQSLLKKEREALLLEQQLAAAKTAPQSSEADARESQTDYQQFYDDLAPYGSWYDSPDYGYVWQPTVCVTDNYWRPYTIGSWANCDQGWAWCSDEPFGWACYHYGRWAQIRGCGWVWVPGDQWAPCWVSWRSNDEYIGWCPMPPETVYNRNCTYGPTIDRDCGINPGCYVFVAAKHFDRPCRNYCEAPVTCLKICASSVNITNIVIHPGRVDCHGPKVDWVTERVRRPVQHYSLARESGRVDREHRTHRTEKDKLHYYAPAVQAPWNSKLAPARHHTLASHEVVRADGGLPDKLAIRYKTERTEREKDAQNLKGSAKALVERQQRLAELEHSRILLREQVARQQASAIATTPDNSTARVGQPDRSGKPDGKGIAPRAEPVTEKPQISTAAQPVPGTPAPVKTRGDLNNNREQINQQREEQSAATSRLQTEKNSKDQQSMLRAQIEEKRRQQTTMENAAAQQAANEQQRRAVEAAARADSAAAAREMEKQTALRAQIEEKRRLQQETQSGQSKSQAFARDTAIEQQRSPSETPGQGMDKQAAIRRQQQDSQNQNDLAAARSAATEQQRRIAEGEAKAEQQARQREALEQQRAAVERQNRQAELAARAEKQQRVAAEMQRRQAEAETRQRQMQEEQRRNAEEQQQRRQEAETRQQRMQDEQRKNAEEQQQRRQAEEQSKAAAEQQRRQENDNNGKDKGKR